MKGGPYSQGVYRVKKDEGCYGLLDVRDRGDSIDVIDRALGFFDAGEDLTYTVAVVNTNRGDDYPSVTATLTPSGPGVTAGKSAQFPVRREHQRALLCIVVARSFYRRP